MGQNIIHEFPNFCFSILVLHMTFEVLELDYYIAIIKYGKVQIGYYHFLFTNKKYLLPGLLHALTW